MGRSSRFAFPRNGRLSPNPRSTSAEDKSSIEMPPRSASPSNASKATRLLGMGSTIHAPPKCVLSPPPMSSDSATISDSDYESDSATRPPSIPPRSGLRPSPPRNLDATRVRSWASSQAIGVLPDADSLASEDQSTIRHRASHRSSSSPLSLYKTKLPRVLTKRPPVEITSTEMRLRKSKVADERNVESSREERKESGEASEPESWATTTSASSRQKPPKLDLARYLPKSKSQNSSPNMLSPRKFTPTPPPLSAGSADFSRHQHIRDTQWSVKSMKSFESKPGNFRISPPKNRVLENDPLDNAKVNIRRPPRGIQHWFEGLEEVSSEDEDAEEESTLGAAPPTIVVSEQQHASHPPRTSSLGRILEHSAEYRLPRLTYKKPIFAPKVESPPAALEPPPAIPERARHGSQGSMDSNTTSVSAKTKESRMSRTNLTTTSLLSISSDDEDEDIGQNLDAVAEVEPSAPDSNGEIGGQVYIGKARAFEIQTKRNASVKSKASARTVNTISSNGTIDMVYMVPPLFHDSPPRESVLARNPSRSQRAGIVHPPPAIMEVDDFPSPADAAQETLDDEEPETPISPGARSIHSVRTCRSEPRHYESTHKLMAVTEEEEALLEMMRRKRALMAKQNFEQGYKTALEMDRKQVLPFAEPKLTPRTSGFLKMDEPAQPEVQSANANSNSNSSSNTSTLSPTMSASLSSRPGSRNRPRPANINTSLDPSPKGSSRASNSTSSTERNFTAYRDLLAPAPAPTPESNQNYLGATPCFTPLDPFPSPTRTATTTASATSPTSASQQSTLTSPATPAPGFDDDDVQVKVASSEPSCSGDDESAMTDLIPSPLDMARYSMTFANQSSNMKMLLSEKRMSGAKARRITSMEFRDSLDLPMQAMSPERHLSRMSSQKSFGSLHTTPRQLNRRASRTSTMSSSGTVRNGSFPLHIDRKSSGEHGLSPRQSRSFTNLKQSRESVLSFDSTRCSASEDVLAAWGSLGGWRDVDAHRNRN